MKFSRGLAVAGLLAALPGLALAADIDGSALSVLWGVPFVGLLLSIALCPLWLPTFWHHHFGKVSAFWGLAFVLPCAFVFGAPLASAVVLHTLISEFVPFIVLLLALFTLSGGIVIRGNLHGSPLLNTSLLAIGTACASVMGTTGAAMLMIRPVLKANDNRRHNVHVVVFFIFLVANIGGGLTPLGDPPLFLGFLKGVSFGWTVTHMAAPVALASVLLLLLFFGVDSYYFRKEGLLPRDPTPDIPWHLAGQVNGLLLLGVVGARLRPGIDIVTAALGLEAAVADADLVITGEGRLDAQSLRGKAPLGVARIARRHGKPVIAIAGGLGDDVVALQAHGVDASFSVVRRPCSLEEALAAAADNLRAAARNIAEVLRIGGGLSAGRSEADGREPTP